MVQSFDLSTEAQDSVVFSDTLYFGPIMNLDKFVDASAMAHFYKGLLGNTPTATEDQLRVLSLTKGDHCHCTVKKYSLKN